jgi:hypothetical protein
VKTSELQAYHNVAGEQEKAGEANEKSPKLPFRGMPVPYLGSLGGERESATKGKAGPGRRGGLISQITEKAKWKQDDCGHIFMR